MSDAAEKKGLRDARKRAETRERAVVMAQERVRAKLQKRIEVKFTAFFCVFLLVACSVR